MYNAVKANVNFGLYLTYLLFNRNVSISAGSILVISFNQNSVFSAYETATTGLLKFRAKS